MYELLRNRRFTRIKKSNAILLLLNLLAGILIIWWATSDYTPDYFTFFNVSNDRSLSGLHCWLSCVKTPSKNINFDKCNEAAKNNLDFSVLPYNNMTGFPDAIVPNIVHLIQFKKQEIDFVQMINIISIVDNHRPEVILIHCSVCPNGTLRGKYWDMLGDQYKRSIQVVQATEPTQIFGKKLDSVQHASDVARIGILMKYGGIYLDNDIYVVRGLHGFRHYEMALAWDDDQNLGTQVLVAHKDARFLKYWIDSYHNYQGKQWYFNAGEYPTISILYKQPHLIHRVKLLFGVHMELFPSIYHTNWVDWRQQYTVHLLIRHRRYLDKDSPIKTFDENNIKYYNRTYGQMARLLLYGTTDLFDA